MQCSTFRSGVRSDGQQMHVDGEFEPTWPRGSVRPERWSRQKLTGSAWIASRLVPVIGDVAGGEHVADVALGHRAVLDLGLAGARRRTAAGRRRS